MIRPRAFSRFPEALGQKDDGGPQNLFSFLKALSILAKILQTLEAWQTKIYGASIKCRNLKNDMKGLAKMSTKLQNRQNM